MSNMAMLQLMRGMGFGLAMATTCPMASVRAWTGEATSYPRDVAEIALAHSIMNKVEAAYRCGGLFEKRRAMRQEWADFVCKS